MKASGKSASRAPLPAISAHNDSILSIVAARSKRTGSAWTHATFTASFIRASVRRAFRPVLRVRGDDVPDADLAVAQDVGVESAAMRQALDDPRLRHRLQVRARLAELDTLAFHVADAEALADQCVDVDSARHDVTPCRRGLQRDAVLVLERLDRLGSDQGDRTPGRRFVEEVAIALDLPPLEPFRPNPPPPGVSIVRTSPAARSRLILAGSGSPFRRLRPGAPSPPPRSPCGACARRSLMIDRRQSSRTRSSRTTPSPPRCRPPP